MEHSSNSPARLELFEDRQESLVQARVIRFPASRDSAGEYEYIEPENASAIFRVGDWSLESTPCIIKRVEKVDDRRHRACPEILAIRYPGSAQKKKERYFQWHEEQLVEIKTIDTASGAILNRIYLPESRYRERAERKQIATSWCLESDGVKASFYGHVRLDENAVLHIANTDSMCCRAEYPDGRIVENCPCTSKYDLESTPATNSCDERKVDHLLAMLGSISHDLRSPLTSIQGLLTLLCAGAFGELPEKATERIAGVEIDLARLIRLTNELLDAEQMVSGEFKLELQGRRVDELFKLTASALSTMAARRQIEINYLPSELQALIDKDRIMRVLINLVSNAIKFSPAGSIVSLQAEPAAPDGKDIMIKVIDTGIGIPARFQSQIFEKFRKVEHENNRVLEEKSKHAPRGYGLGLAISKSICEAHGGEIGVYSRPGYGSTFWLRLPASPPES